MSGPISTDETEKRKRARERSPLGRKKKLNPARTKKFKGTAKQTRQKSSLSAEVAATFEAGHIHTVTHAAILKFSSFANRKCK